MRPLPKAPAIEVCFNTGQTDPEAEQFSGDGASAVRWQASTALLVCVLLRLHGLLSAGAHSSKLLFAVVRSAVWVWLYLLELLRSYGTASG